MTDAQKARLRAAADESSTELTTQAAQVAHDYPVAASAMATAASVLSRMADALR